jgi:putative transposase
VLAESVNGLYTAEVIHRQTWRSLEQIELVTAEWVEWWNQRRLHTAIDDLPPAEYEARYNQQH